MYKGKDVRKFLIENSNGIGKNVMKGDDIPNEMAETASKVCKRKFLPEDIVLLILLDEKGEGKSGTVFTEKGFYQWDEGERFKKALLYKRIGAFGYGKNKLYIKHLFWNLHFTFECGNEKDEEDYSFRMNEFLGEIITFLGVWDKYLKKDTKNKK